MKYLVTCTSPDDGVLSAHTFDDFHDAWKKVLDDVAADISEKAEGENKTAERMEYDLGSRFAIRLDGKVLFMYQTIPID